MEAVGVLLVICTTELFTCLNMLLSSPDHLPGMVLGLFPLQNQQEVYALNQANRSVSASIIE